jgi:hypothetical protein
MMWGHPYHYSIVFVVSINIGIDLITIRIHWELREKWRRDGENIP